MSINKNDIEKSFDEFSSDLIQKIKLFFKSFKELTRENIDNFLDCIGLLDIWNSEDEKQFLMKTFNKYKIEGKIIESSVLKGMEEILSNEDIKNSINSSNEKNETNYSRDDNINLMKLSFNKINSISLMKSSLNEDFDNNKNIKINQVLENLDKYIKTLKIKTLKKN